MGSPEGFRAEPQRKSNSVHFGLKCDIWWRHFGPTVVDSYAKPLVHYWPMTASACLCIELAKLHRRKRARMPAAVCIERKRCTSSNTIRGLKRVHLWRKMTASGAGGGLVPPLTSPRWLRHCRLCCWAEGNLCVFVSSSPPILFLFQHQNFSF